MSSHTVVDTGKKWRKLRATTQVNSKYAEPEEINASPHMEKTTMYSQV